MKGIEKKNPHGKNIEFHVENIIISQPLKPLLVFILTGSWLKEPEIGV